LEIDAWAGILPDNHQTKQALNLAKQSRKLLVAQRFM